MPPPESEGLDPVRSAASCVCLPGGELGVALSGGGARGLAQLGVLKVLDRSGVGVSYVSGTSAGAIVGAAYVAFGNAADAERCLLRYLQSEETGFTAAALPRAPVRGLARTFSTFAISGGPRGRTAPRPEVVPCATR